MSEHVNYLGRIIPTLGFRAFVYALDGAKKLVEGWDAYQEHMSSGLWLASLEDVASKILECDSQSRRAKKGAPKDLEPKTLPEDKIAANDAMPDAKSNDLAFEVKNDGFLPKES